MAKDYVPSFKLVNLKGDLFATLFSFGALGVVKLLSSLVLTRILRPEAYGILTILMSIVFVVEMLADIGINLFVIRDQRADEPRYLNTAWTIRLGRSLLNAAVFIVFGPLIASSIYGAPELSLPLRTLSLLFVLGGLESMSFPIAIRRKQSRLLVYTDLGATVVSTIFAIVYTYYNRTYWGILFATLLNRLIMTGMSYAFFPEIRPKLQLDRQVAREIFGLTKYTMPSSLLTLALSQFDKLIFLKLFDLRLLGVYGLAINLASPVEALIAKISQTVLYPRLAHNYRADPSTFVLRYYTENFRLFLVILIAPALVGGAAHFIVTLLYDPRYAQAAGLLQALMIRAAVLALAAPAEDLLMTAGESQVILISSILRTTSMIVGSLLGYYFFGFWGFIYGVGFSGVPTLLYCVVLQSKKRMLIPKYELYKLACMAAVATVSYVGSSLLMTWWHVAKIKLH